MEIRIQDDIKNMSKFLVGIVTNIQVYGNVCVLI